MIPREQVERLVAEAVVKAVAEARAEIKLTMQAALDEAKATIAKLLAQIYGTKAETSQVVLTAEGQQFIDAAWKMAQDVTPAPAPPIVADVELKTVRKARDRRGLAQRHPTLPIQETEADVPPELAEQVAAGALVAQRSGRFQDALVVPKESPFIRRVHEIELVAAATGATVLQLTPDRIVPGGDLADETIHGFVVGKMADAMPYHRQIARLARIDIEISKQTVNDSMNAWGEVFAPMAEAIAGQVLLAPVVHADASWQRLQAKQSCKRVHVWTIVGGGQVAFRLTTDLKHARAAELIPADFQGRLMTDAWPGWFILGLGVRLAFCLAHARRPFADWAKRNPANPNAQQMLAHYRQLYRLEHETDHLPPDQRLDQRRAIRDQRSRPIMDRIKALAVDIAATYDSSHQLANGARYIIDYWPQLTRFLDCPELPLDNNAAENALRINALIRKNSLFIGSEAAGHRDAVALTILHSCRLLRLDPAAYLARVTPTLLLHRRGRRQDLSKITPKAIAASGLG